MKVGNQLTTLQGPSVDKSGGERGEEKGASDGQTSHSVTSVLFTETVVDHDRVCSSPGKTFSPSQTLGVWQPAAAPDYSHLILDNLDGFPATVSGVASGVILQWEMGHTVILLVTVHQLRSIIVEGVRTVPVIVAVAGETLYS